MTDTGDVPAQCVVVLRGPDEEPRIRVEILELLQNFSTFDSLVLDTCTNHLLSNESTFF